MCYIVPMYKIFYKFKKAESLPTLELKILGEKMNNDL